MYRRKFCGLIGSVCSTSLLSGCLTGDGADVGLGRLVIANWEENPRSGRVWLALPSGSIPLATPTEETVWEATYDISANDPSDVVTPSAAYDDELPGDVAPYILHLEPEDGTERSWDLSKQFADDDDCVQVQIHFEPEHPPSLFVSRGCDTIPE